MEALQDRIMAEQSEAIAVIYWMHEKFNEASPFVGEGFKKAEKCMQAIMKFIVSCPVSVHES